MNKQEKLIAILLGLALAGWMWYSLSGQKNAAAEAQAQQRIQASQTAAGHGVTGPPSPSI